MLETWGNYQSAIQLVAAINLALLAFPTLRQPETTHEAEKWDRLLRSVPIDDPDHGRVRYAAVTFRRTRDLVERQNSWARSACIFATILNVTVLFWATLHANEPVSKAAAWITIAIGLVPVLYFCLFDFYIVRQVHQAAANRKLLIRDRRR